MSYLTWLDWYASGAAEKLRAGGYSGASDFSDAEALWVMSISSVAEMNITRNCAIPPAEMAQFAFFGAVAAFVAPPRLRERNEFSFLDSETQRAMFMGGRGLKMSPRLVRALAHASAPKTDEFVAMLRDHCWYIDMPAHALMLGDRQVRAILTQPDSLGGVVAIAVLTEPGADEMAGRYAWMIVGDSAIPDGCADIDIDPAELRRRASDFIALALLYYRSLEGEIQTLPRQITPVRGTKIQRKLERRTKSLFVVHVLPDPKNNLGRPVEPSDGNGWRLDHRVTVRGHFRWQPVGEGRAKRELRWIAEHQRGKDLPDKPTLTPLRKQHESRK